MADIGRLISEVTGKENKELKVAWKSHNQRHLFVKRLIFGFHFPA